MTQNQVKHSLDQKHRSLSQLITDLFAGDTGG